ncbi:acetylornithine aminotransferase [Clostridium pasteurianum]|nr:aspartate aminotransferase family protein [Clostridium pasteurianum]AOZ75025.1 acetylornithine aminotransferase [Clostridium pasteurianum DSM 525 = ATCC 6013]AOZ78820.1 acetylornithine aminotransferase [Clostridium pasteurianum]ELP59627.1 N-acetylornithine aminotransferase [Clostridium pasteurianum DSM 525 = ATCC 6013]OMH22703.1 acetylornithine aminotransferase [Clostridium pasteurianum]UZW15888.1 aspartate aminotransferase family protein [Clostridium pasteurianum]
MSKSNIMNTYGRFDVVFEKGKGARIFDSNGKEYIDFVSGVAVNCLGHSNDKIVNTIKTQAEKLMHISNYYWNQNAMDLAEKLCENTDHQKVFFCNSGTESIETALKLSRKYGRTVGTDEKSEIIYMDNSFHGRTMGSLSVTGQPKYQKQFKPLIGNVKSVKFNDMEDIKSAISENTCAVIVEPIQGEGGIVCAEKEYLQLLRELCDKHNALLIFDEVQCGIGRSGKLFAYQKYDVVPDVICMAKALGGGFPIGAVLAKEKAASAFVPGDHGNTFGGNPMGTAIGLCILNELIDGKIIDSVDEKGVYIKSKLVKFQEKYNCIKEIRGMGLLIGIQVNVDTKMIINKCFEKGLLVITAGADVVRILPPLNVDKKDIDDALGILEEVFKEI